MLQNLKEDGSKQRGSYWQTDLHALCCYNGCMENDNNFVTLLCHGQCIEKMTLLWMIPRENRLCNG